MVDVEVTYFSICKHKLVFLFSFDVGRLSSRSGNLENKTKYVAVSL